MNIGEHLLFPFTFETTNYKTLLKMKTTKLTLDKFAGNALSKNEKKNILGKGDGIFLEVQEVYEVVVATSGVSDPTDPPITTTPPPTKPPYGSGGGSGDGRMSYPIKL